MCQRHMDASLSMSSGNLTTTSCQTIATMQLQAGKIHLTKHLMCNKLGPESLKVSILFHKTLKISYFLALKFHQNTDRKFSLK